MSVEQQFFRATTDLEVAPIRRAVGERLTWAGFGPRHVSEATIMVGELITNALVHARSPADVALEIQSNAARVFVHDGSDQRPVVRPLDPAQPGGNGMRIVEALSDEWGTEMSPGEGKTVWFSLLRR